MRHTAGGAALTDLILEVFRVNGDLLRAGDRLTEPFGQTSSRWQVLGAIAEEALTVSGIAREMGLTRQSVQRTTDLLEADGLVTYIDNPSHRRAKLVRPTKRGERVYAQLSRDQITWANGLAAATAGERRLRTALEVLRRVRAELESADGESLGMERSGAPEVQRRRTG